MKIWPILILSVMASGQTTITWSHKGTLPGTCNDQGSPPCYFPSGQGFGPQLVGDPINGGVIIYADRQASYGTVHVTNGSSTVTWVSGDLFGLSWGVGSSSDSSFANDQLFINGTAYNLASNQAYPASTTTQILASSWAGTTGTYPYISKNGALTVMSDWYHYDTAAHAFRYPSGQGGTLSNYSAHMENDAPTSPVPADRQSTNTQSLDISRNAMWLTGGVNGSVSWNCGTNSSGTGNCGSGVPGWRATPVMTTWRQDLASGTWTAVSATHHPWNAGTTQSSTFDPDDQVLIQAGTNGSVAQTWIYCPTDKNPTPGALTPGQISAGCLADDWVLVSTSGTTLPSGYEWSQMMYLHSVNKVLAYSQSDGAIYLYAPKTKTWSTSACTTMPFNSGLANGGWAAITVLNSGQVLYHYIPTSGTATQDWLYVPWTDSCSQLTSSGTGPSVADAYGGEGASAYYYTELGVDPFTGVVVAWTPPESAPVVWEASLNYPTLTSLIVQEALYSGGPTTGVARTDEPVCQGVPIQDSAGITSTNSLGLTGASAAQFRILGSWPSGNAKWIEVCGIVPSVTAGGTATLTLTTSGSGNVGGNSLASGTSTITVNNTGGTIACGSVGATCWTIKAAGGYNVFDTVTVGATTIVATGTSDGIVVTGPSTTGTFPNNVTCGSGAGQSPCTLDYKSSNDSGSSCTIEKNGPVEAVVRCVGTLYDGSSHPYGQYTTRTYFYQGKSNVKLEVIERNANYSTAATPSADCNPSGGVCTGLTFNTAYKGRKDYEVRLKFANPSSASTLNYTFATDTSTSTGTLSASGGTDSAYIYQGQSTSMIGNSDCAYTSACANTYTTDIGWNIVKNASSITTGNQTQYPTGWADISDGSGNGLEIGVYQFAAYFAKSLEFNGGGTDVRIGLSPSENGNPSGGPGNGTFFQYQPWPAWTISEVFIEPHTSAPSSLANEFLKFQAYLLMRPSTVAYINSTGVYPYNLPTPTNEDTFYVAAAASSNPALTQTRYCYGGSSNCYPDLGVTSTLIAQNRAMSIYHQWTWAGGGPGTQEEFRWSNTLNFLKRGYTGSYLTAQHFYRFVAEKSYVHADGTSSTDSTVNGFHWSSRPVAGSTNAEQDGNGYSVLIGGTSNFCCAPLSRIQNSANSFIDVSDGLHDHTYHIEDFYMLSGDETIREAIVPKTDYFTNPNTYQGKVYTATSGGLGPLRANAIEMLGGSLMSEYLYSIGDSTNGAAALNQALLVYTNQTLLDLCMTDGAGNNYPSGCNPPPVSYFLEHWQASTSYSQLAGIVDSNGNTQTATTGGTSQSGTHPTWGTTLSSTTSDGTVTWTLTRIGNTLPFGYDPPGVSKVRGTPWAPNSRGGAWCGNATTFLRGNDMFQASIYIEGILAVRHAKPPTWTQSDYNKALDIAYGISSWATTEPFRLDGTGVWYSFPQSGINAAYNGIMVGVVYDIPQECNVTGGFGGTAGTNYGHGPLIQFGGTGTIYDPYSMMQPDQGMWMIFYPQVLVNGGLTSTQVKQIQFVMDWNANQGFGAFQDDGHYQLGAMADAIYNPPANQLQDISFTCTNCSGGTTTYNLTFTPPSNACSTTGCLRVKWATEPIVNSGGYSTISPSEPGGLLGYDPMVTQAFALNPYSYSTWFGSNAISEPSITPGTAMSVNVATGTTGLTASDFSVKVAFPSSQSAATHPSATTSGVTTSGAGHE